MIFCLLGLVTFASFNHSFHLNAASSLYYAYLLCRFCKLMFYTGKLMLKREDLVACQCSCTMVVMMWSTMEFQSKSIQVWLRYVLCLWVVTGMLLHSHVGVVDGAAWTYLQVCSHTGPIVDPDKRDVELGSPSISDVAAFIQMHFKGIDLKPSIEEHCLYTVSVTCGILLSSAYWF